MTERESEQAYSEKYKIYTEEDSDTGRKRWSYKPGQNCPFYEKK